MSARHTQIVPKKASFTGGLQPFWSVPVIGAMSPREAAPKLAALGYGDVAKELEFSEADRLVSIKLPWGGPKPWVWTSHEIGFIAPLSANTSGTAQVTDAVDAGPDKGLIGSKVKISLGRLNAFNYPGGGDHQVLLQFSAQNQLSKGTQQLQFVQTYRISQGGQAGVEGYPIFVGLRVGSEGLSFKCATVNVKNEDDQRLLSFLDSDAFKAGLKLVDALNPAVPLVAAFAEGLATSLLKRHDNVKVQNVELGLDFSDTAFSPKLAEGSYVAVQKDEAENWDGRIQSIHELQACFEGIAVKK